MFSACNDTRCIACSWLAPHSKHGSCAQLCSKSCRVQCVISSTDWTLLRRRAEMDVGHDFELKLVKWASKHLTAAAACPKALQSTSVHRKRTRLENTLISFEILENVVNALSDPHSERFTACDAFAFGYIYCISSYFARIAMRFRFDSFRIAAGRDLWVHSIANIWCHVQESL